MIGQAVDFLFREWLKPPHGNANKYIQKTVFLGVFHHDSDFHFKVYEATGGLCLAVLVALFSCGMLFPWHTCSAQRVPCVPGHGL